MPINEIDNNNIFHHSLLKVMAANWNNDLKDNFDFFRFGDNEKEVINGQKNFLEIVNYLAELESFFYLLSDIRSKEMLHQLLAFRIMGHRKIRLYLSRPEYWKSVDDLDSFMDHENKLEVNFLRSVRNLSFADLTPLGLPVKLYTMPRTVLSQFLLKQYEYLTDDQLTIGAQPGDVVIDGGACWGDTSLFFANKVKENGKVFSFEFIPGNLRVAYKNISLNPQFEKTIKIIENPLWNESGVKMFYDDNGPGSRVSAKPLAGHKGEVHTISIDDFVNREQLDKVDLIKMDIEGAEQYALKGAEETLRRFKPTLAISIYHNMSDFANVVHLINNFNLSYKFYLNHFTIHHEETVLYAKA